MGKECELVNLERNRHHIAREKLIKVMLEGHTFQEVSGGSPMPEKRSMAYHLLRAILIKGSMALSDERYGHPINYVEKHALFSKPPAERLPARRIPPFRLLCESALVPRKCEPVQSCPGRVRREQSFQAITARKKR